jgi:hypothetical protein
MARTLSTIRNYAPYVFLSTGGQQGEYKLFIAVPFEAGKKVVYNNDLTYLNGTTMLSFSIVTDTSVTSAGKEYKGIVLNPDNAAKGGAYTFNSATFSIKVETQRNAVVAGQTVVITQKLHVFYDSADANTAATGDIAKDCPYIYLTNPITEAGGANSEFTPFCLVPLENYEEDTQNYNDSVGGVQGQCLQEISLKSPLPAGKTEIAPANITANTVTYTDPGQIQGYFEVILEYPPVSAGAPKVKRKGKIRNVSSDPNQGNFIEII